MKSLKLLVFVLSVLIGMSAFAQQSVFSIHAGYLNPKDTKGGLLVGGMFGRAIDEAS